MELWNRSDASGVVSGEAEQLRITPHTPAPVDWEVEERSPPTCGSRLETDVPDEPSAEGPVPMERAGAGCEGEGDEGDISVCEEVEAVTPTRRGRPRGSKNGFANLTRPAGPSGQYLHHQAALDRAIEAIMASQPGLKDSKAKIQAHYQLMKAEEFGETRDPPCSRCRRLARECRAYKENVQGDVGHSCGECRRVTAGCDLPKRARTPRKRNFGGVRGCGRPMMPKGGGRRGGGRGGGGFSAGDTPLIV